MDATLLSGDAFWQDASPVAMAGPGVSGPDLSAAPNQVFFQTSGSTTAPKWIGLTKEALLSSAKAVNDHLKVVGESCWGLILPLHHVGGFGVVARARERGCRLCARAGKWDAPAVAAWLKSERVTHTSMVPTQVHDLVQGGVGAPDSLVAVVVGGGRLEPHLGQAARALGWPILASYGMTEAGSQIATQGLEALNADYRSAPIPLLPHWLARVDGEGLLEISGSALFAGWLLADGSSWVYRARSGNGFTTRDRVELHDGMLTPLGRADLQVKVLGELVELESIERELIELSAGMIPVDSLVVAAVPDARAEHALVPVCDGLLNRSMVHDVLQRHAARAPGYLRLADPVFVDPFPRSDLGKALRQECARQIT